jgi:hypothetical protein
MTRLSTVPVGLLGLLGIKNDGTYPGVLNDVMSGTLDILQWLAGNYASEFISDSTGVINATGQKVGIALTSLVPQGQCWLVHNSFSTGGGGAADFVAMSHQVVRQSGGAVLTRRDSGIVRSHPQDATGVGGCPAYLQGPYLMFPGDQWCTNVVKQTFVAGFNSFLQGYVYRFQL